MDMVYELHLSRAVIKKDEEAGSTEMISTTAKVFKGCQKSFNPFISSPLHFKKGKIEA